MARNDAPKEAPAASPAGAANPSPANLPAVIRQPPSKVFLVGAGPGHPGLLTLRAVECLAQADVVLYDRLVPEAMLRHAPAAAERICVTELASSHRDRYLPIHDCMLERVRQGKCVVRLKGGDPFIFGRGGEEAEVLARQGIPFEVVPGVTAAVGVAACAGIPLTHRSHASAVALVAGHENPDKPDSSIDWSALARFPGTLVIYMGLSRLGHNIQNLMQHGKDPQTPAAAVQLGTTGQQRTVTASLHDLPELVRQAGLTSPALVVIGSVVELRQHLQWFEQRPLFGRRILVTRPREQAAELAQRLELLGAVPFVLPAVEIRELSDWSAVDRAIEQLHTFHWLVFTSANGVHAFLGRLKALGKDWRVLGPLKIAAIGPKTAEVLAGYHLRADVMPEVFRSEELAETLKPLVQGQKVLLARADRGRDVLPRELATVAQVQQLAVYSQVDAATVAAALLDRLRRGEMDFVTLTSPSIAAAFLHSLDEVCRTRLVRGEIKLVAISPVTSGKVRELGFAVAAEAQEYTAAGLLEALIRLNRGERDGSAQIFESIPAEVENDAAGQDGQDIHKGADAAEGNTGEQIEKEQKQ